MTRQTVEYRGQEHLVSFPDDEPRKQGSRVRAVIRGLLVDEITNRPPEQPVHVATTRPGLVGRVGAGGVAGLIGVPERVLPVPELVLPPTSDHYPVHVELLVRADGFVPIEREIEIPHTTDFPDAFDVHELGRIDLHREPIVIHGRVTRRADGSPVGGAAVSIAEIWPVLPDPTGPGTGDLPNLLSLTPPLFADFKTGASRVRSVVVAPAIETHELLEAVASGNEELQLSTRVGLGAGDVLMIHAGHPDLQEFGEITAVDGGALPERPARIRLRRPLAFNHPVRTIASRAVPGPLGAANALSRDAIDGDRCVVLNSMTGLPSPFVAVDDAGAGPTDFHAAGSFVVGTDSNGLFRFPPLSRVAQVRIHVDDGGGNTLDVEYSPNYAEYVNWLDMSL